MLRIFGTALVLFASSACLAKQDPAQLMELSLDELLALEVTVASRNAQSINEAPSSVSVFTRNQIQTLGVQDVYALLNYVPGFQVSRGDWVGAVPKEHARGVYLDNGYVLFLINGERLNEMSFGKASVYNPFINLNVVERVEVIRGPGSALYGSNAFMGVVNIITRKQASWLSAGVGESQAQQVSVGLSESIAGAELQLLVDWRESEGNDYLFRGKSTSDPYEHGFAQITLEYAGLALSGRWNYSDLGDFVNLGGVNPQNFHESQNYAYAAKYQYSYSDDTALTAKLHFTEHEIKSAGNVLDSDAADFISNDFLTGPYWITEDLEFELLLQHSYFSGAQLTAGLSLRRAEQTQAGTVTNYQDPATGDIALADQYYLGLPRAFANQGVNARSPLLSNQDTNSLFVQYDFTVGDKVTAHIGARYDDVKQIDSNFSPRLSFNYQMSEQHLFKFHYGEAFRTPVTNELFSEDLVTIGNPDLKPEQIATTELVWLNQTDHYRLELVYFHNELEGFVNKLPLSNSLTQFTFQNDINRTITGAELASTAKLGDISEITFNFTHIFNEPINPSYRKFANLGVRGMWLDNTIGIDLLWRDALQVDGSFSHGSYALFNLKLSRYLTPELQISLASENLFDKSYQVYEPRVAGGGMPGMGRQAWLTLDFSF